MQRKLPTKLAPYQRDHAQASVLQPSLFSQGVQTRPDPPAHLHRGEGGEGVSRR
jgi:hypothetical protein